MKIALDPFAFKPERAYPTDAGLDLKTPFGFVLEGRTSVVIDTGVHVQIPEGYAGLVMSKSGLNVKDGITVEGVVDAGYSGSIVCKLYNNSTKEKEFPIGAKIAQLLVVPIITEPIEFVDEIQGGDRGNRGFGSSGI